MADARAGAGSSSLLSRLLAAVIVILAVGAVFVSLFTWFNGRSAAWAAYDRLLLGAANDIAESIRIVDGQPVVTLSAAAFELLSQAPDDRIAYAVRGPQGVLIAGMEDTPEPDSRRARMPAFFDGAMQGEDARYVETARRFAEREFSGVVRVTVGQTMIARRALAADLMLNALLPLGVLGLGLIVISVLVVRGAVRPLADIADGLSRRDPYDLTLVPTAGVPREIAVILIGMNRFIGRLDRQFSSMQSLISDTAHQLRTPVAAIRALAENAVEDSDTPARNRHLTRLADRTRSLGVLLDQMLSRALVIHRMESIPRKPIDLRDIALDLMESCDSEVLAPGAEIGLVIGETPVMVAGDDFSLLQAGRNLLSNALKHGRPPVRIGADSEAGRARLWIEDAGPGMDPALVAAIGTRFQRSAASREDSAGLGLSIVAAVAQAFDGEVRVERGDGRFRIALVFPVLAGGSP